jgi:hypothetical protein
MKIGKALLIHILFIVSVAILIYGSYVTVVVFSEEDVFGLAEKLNISLWIGLASIMISLLLLIFDSEYGRYEKLFLLEACLLALYLYAIPVFVEENIRFPDTWVHSAGSLSILMYGNYNQPLYAYAREYPGVFMLQSIAFLITGIKPNVLMKYYPILFSVILVLTSYILFRKLIRDRRMVYFATLFFVTGSVWVFPNHFCPSSFAFIWFLLFFCLIFSERSQKVTLLSILIAIAIIVSHPITSLFLVLLMTAIPLGLVLAEKSNIFEKIHLPEQRPWTLSHVFTIFFFVSWFAWFLFNATGTFTDLTNTLVLFLTSLGQYLTSGSPTERLSTTSFHHIGQTLKICYSLLYFLVSVTGTLYLLFERFRNKKKEHIHILTLMIAWIAGCGIFGLATGFIQAGEFFERPLLYAFVPLSFLAAFSYKTKFGKVILLSVMLIGAPLSILASYSNESFEYPPISDSFGATFMVNHNITDMHNVVVGDPTGAVYSFYASYWHFRHGSDPANLASGNSTFLVWSRASSNFYSFYLKGRTYPQTSSYATYMSWMEKYPNITLQPGFNAVYDSGDFHLWLVMDKNQVQQQETG